MILGVDEAGRGPWAGPLVVGAAVLGGVNIDGLTDSKKLTKKKCEQLYDEIAAEAAAFATGWVSAEELDEVGLAQALRLATRRAVEQVRVSYSEIIIDGTVNFLSDTGKGPYVTTMKKADLLVPSVSAASIVAKVERDRFMTEQDAVYPGYGFGSHAGYGVAAHRAALDKLGLTPLHRRSFAPIAQYCKVGPCSKVPPCNDRGEGETSRRIGDVSEAAAAEYLQSQGYEVVERNWKTKACEIDIVAEKSGVWYFVEVKHRKTDRQGGGLAAITKEKLEQMAFAARMYAHWNKADDADMRLMAIATSGQPPVVVECLEL